VPGAGLQTIEYAYNVRGQMRGVNLDENDNPQVSQNELFSYKLDYHENGRYFDGSISKMTWKSSPLTPGGGTGTRSYTYTYDRAGRLTSAISGASEENFSIPRVSYDVNGNITFLSRMAKVPFNGNFLTTKIDSLNYQYFNGGNKLKSVTDNAIRATLGGFKNGTNSGDDYAYYADGKLQKDLNRNISLIEYNYLDLVSKVKFANNDSIQYFYTSTGEKRRTERTLGGQKSYTFYDGEMIYTATGNLTSLNDYRLSEIQNSEGRYVNGKLEYGYTDHLGNLRLSYKDSLGTAFVTQGYAYDAWGLELKLHRYQFSSANNDRYTWQGKEDLELDGLDNWSDFGWRIEDRTLGRWFTPDPEDQFQMISSFAYCGNNPIMRVDPDGRAFQLLPFLAATIFSGHVGGMISMGNGGSYGKGFLTGAVTGALGGVAGAFAPVGLLPGMGYGAVTGAGIGGINSSISGGNFWDGALSGGISGGILGGAFGYLAAAKLGINRLTGTGTSVNAFEMRPVSEEVGEEWFSSTQEMREHYNATIGARDNMTIEQVEGKLNTTVDMASGRNLAKGYSIDENGLIKTPNGYAGGITTNHYKGGWLSSNHTGILIAPRIKGYSLEAQNGVFKHEFMHAWHWNNSPNMQEHLRYSERATSSFSVAYSKTFNLDLGLIGARRELLGAGGSFYPANYSWRLFNKTIPTWIK
jgi:RHS repeat-associated protein